MEEKRKYLPDIVKNIRETDPYKIILFGSYAGNTFSEDSDIDLLVVLNSLGIAKNYDEKMRNKLLVRRKIYKLSKKIPIDLLVYTRGEYEVVLKNESSFCNEIQQTGKVLYEKTD
ncbi:MAG: nucleotidyltransferase domain-containing protein [Candidatus Electrothrix sp. AUS1_2]|nr:nucleotidyltransferase domain-containing protein [Candidatus Electrothrix sp. AUS1_2]